MAKKYEIIYLSRGEDQKRGQIWSELEKVNGRGIESKLDRAFKNTDRDLHVVVELGLWWSPRKPVQDRAIEFVTSVNDFWTDLYDAMRSDWEEIESEMGDSDFAYHVQGIVARYA